MAYATKATTSGGRNGRAVLENGGLALAIPLCIPQQQFRESVAR